MYLFCVLFLFNELVSFCVNANLMAAKFRIVKKIENVASDIIVLEEWAISEWIQMEV